MQREGVWLRSMVIDEGDFGSRWSHTYQPPWLNNIVDASNFRLCSFWHRRTFLRMDGSSISAPSISYGLEKCCLDILGPIPSSEKVMEFRVWISTKSNYTLEMVLLSLIHTQMACLWYKLTMTYKLNMSWNHTKTQKQACFFFFPPAEVLIHKWQAYRSRRSWDSQQLLYVALQKIVWYEKSDYCINR